MRQWNEYPEDGELVYEVQVDPHEIHYLCAITESCEGLAVVRTKDEKLGIVQFWVPVGLQADFEAFVQRLSGEVAMRIAAPRPHLASDFDEELREHFTDQEEITL